MKIEVYYGIESTGTQVFTLNGVAASASSGTPKIQNCPDVSPTVVTYTFPVSALVKSGANSFRGSSGGGAHGFSPNPAWDGAHARVLIEE